MIYKFWLAFLVLYLYKIFSISTKCLLKLLSSEHPITLCVDSLCHLSVTLPLALPHNHHWSLSNIQNLFRVQFREKTSWFHVSAWLAWSSNITFYLLLLPRYNASSALQQISSTFANAFADIFAARRATRTAFFWPNSPAGSDQPGLHTQLNVFWLM